MELLYATLIFLIGLGVLISGAEIFIHHSAQLGAKLGISDVIVGITLSRPWYFYSRNIC